MGLASVCQAPGKQGQELTRVTQTQSWGSSTCHFGMSSHLAFTAPSVSWVSWPPPFHKERLRTCKAGEVCQGHRASRAGGWDRPSWRSLQCLLVKLSLCPRLTISDCSQSQSFQRQKVSSSFVISVRFTWSSGSQRLVGIQSIW